MRISDWSSDVCSSDLIIIRVESVAGLALAREHPHAPAIFLPRRQQLRQPLAERHLRDAAARFVLHETLGHDIFAVFDDDIVIIFSGLQPLGREDAVGVEILEIRRSEERRVGKEWLSTLSLR